jgi:hypothetical protein
MRNYVSPATIGGAALLAALRLRVEVEVVGV